MFKKFVILTVISIYKLMTYFCELLNLVSITISLDFPDITKFRMCQRDFIHNLQAEYRAIFYHRISYPQRQSLYSQTES
jgi:hypothetical protein